VTPLRSVAKRAMTMAVGLNLLMLLGLAGLAIPPIVHLLNRRRYDVVHWGAMQFLQISEITRRKLLIEELLLMALRMLLIAVLVLGLASPWAIFSFFDKLGTQESRDVVIIIDGSASMSRRDQGSSPHELACAWAKDFIAKLRPGDSVAIVQSQQQVVPVFPVADEAATAVAIPALTHKLQNAAAALDDMPPPRGSCDLPLAVEAAHQILSTSRRPQQDIIILTDGQRQGLADDATKSRWRRLEQKLDADERTKLFLVNVMGEDSTAPANWSVQAVRAGKALASQRVFLESQLRIQGGRYEPPYRLQLEVDQVPVATLPAPSAADFRSGQIPLQINHMLTPGSHLLSLVVDPDPPVDERAEGYVVKDQVPADNRQDLAVMVRLLPVLLADGGTEKPVHHGADLLKTALTATTGEQDLTLVRPRLVTIGDFVPDMLKKATGPEPNTIPRVLILCNVTELDRSQEAAVTEFIENGGHVLVTLGNRLLGTRNYYNQRLYRDGEGWLPARVEEVQGDEFAAVSTDSAAKDPAVFPARANYTHPALGMLRPDSPADLDRSRFPRWWKLGDPAAGSGAIVIARFDNGHPFLVERNYGKGGVILSAVPLDESWRTNLHSGVTGVLMFLHELLYYLEGARSSEFNVVPGRPLIYQPFDDEKPGSMSMQPPHGPKREISADKWPLVRFSAPRRTARRAAHHRLGRWRWS